MAVGGAEAQNLALDWLLAAGACSQDF